MIPTINNIFIKKSLKTLILRLKSTFAQNKQEQTKKNTKRQNNDSLLVLQKHLKK